MAGKALAHLRDPWLATFLALDDHPADLGTEQAFSIAPLGSNAATASIAGPLVVSYTAVQILNTAFDVLALRLIYRLFIMPPRFGQLVGVAGL